MVSTCDMVRLNFVLAAGVLAVLGTAITQLVQLTFVESAAVNAAVEGLFVGAVIYFGLKTLELSANPQ